MQCEQLTAFMMARDFNDGSIVCTIMMMSSDSVTRNRILASHDGMLEVDCGGLYLPAIPRPQQSSSWVYY